VAFSSLVNVIITLVVNQTNKNPPTPCLGKRPQRPKPRRISASHGSTRLLKGLGKPWEHEAALARGRTLEAWGFGHG